MIIATNGKHQSVDRLFVDFKFKGSLKFPWNILKQKIISRAIEI